MEGCRSRPPGGRSKPAQRPPGEDGADGGEDRNALLNVKLTKGKEYVLRVRLYYSQASGETAVMLW